MDASAPPGPASEGTDRLGIGLEIRHAVYLTGGLILLAIGIMELADELGPILSCAWQTSYCPGPISDAFIVETTPALIGGLFLVVVAITLLRSARRTLQRLPPIF
jgi:hypothetical protein